MSGRTAWGRKLERHFVRSCVPSPAAPRSCIWVTAAVVLLPLLTANPISVKLFGRFEFCFSLIKVVMNIVVIALGLSIIPFAFGDLGLVGMTARAAKNAERVLPRAINTVALRIAVFPSARSSNAFD